MKKQDTKHSEKLANKSIEDVYAVCSVCGTRFVRHEDSDKPNLYCEECARKVKIQQTLQRQEIERSKKKNICENCGVEFDKKSNRQKYCEYCVSKIRKEQNRLKAKRHRNKIKSNHLES